MTDQAPRTKGFKRTATLLQSQIRRVGEGRGFAVTRLLTHWPEVAGEAIAAVARPVDVKYGRQGFGATLTILTTGSQAPMLEMQKEQLRERVNAVYGYNAIARIRITQTAPVGFSEGQADFAHKAVAKAKPAPSPEITQSAKRVAQTVGDQGLRQALETLAINVLSREKR